MKNIAIENRKRRAAEYVAQQNITEQLGLMVLGVGCCLFGAFCALVGVL